MKKRLFIGISIPEKQQELFAKKTEKLQNKNLRLIKKENFHITLVFLGSVEIKEIETIETFVGEICSLTKPFNLEVEKVEWALRKQMLWVFYKDSENFSKLVAKIYSILSSLVEPKKRKPQPHTTLARSKNKVVVDLKPFNSLQGKQIQVKTITLFESKPGRGGSTYTRVADFYLTDAYV